ncbi:hypothetical protein [Neptuniibacter halophilus]|uniref:hypothetical protein n=1 Tax=Neptuniibacter halophilus TaxID=651666 RepID=UPI00257350D4|nr:hypothetical protein [Neptuniibacter halophilus]
MSKRTLTTCLLAAAGIIPALPVQAETYYELSGKVSGELRAFTQDAQFPHQDYDTNLSFSIEPEFFWEWNDGNDSLTFSPFLRIDEQDSERTHADIRELSWIHVEDEWELRLGLRKVFWGVTEFNHLVDVINQTDGVEDFDGEDKLGQPMLNLSLVRDWGIVDLFLLPGFRERTFAGENGRLRSGLVVDTDRAEYESAAGQKHLDTAIRWSHTLGDFDLGAYWFHGTNRDPLLQARMVDGTTRLTPYYEQIDQVGLDLQATIDSWLWKLETIHRDSSRESFWAAQGGFEYTFYGLNESAADLGVLLEYGWDQRGTDADAAIQNDLFMGARLTLNDAASSELLAGISHDLDYHSHSLIVEASRRYGDNWKLSLDGRFFSADDSRDLSYQIRQDDHLQLTLERYF